MEIGFLGFGVSEAFFFFVLSVFSSEVFVQCCRETTRACESAKIYESVFGLIFMCLGSRARHCVMST